MTADEWPIAAIADYFQHGVDRIELFAALDGGHGSSGLDIIDVLLSTGDTVRLVRKRPHWDNEILALRALSEIDMPPNAVPTLIADGQDSRGRWLLVPYFEGAHPAAAPPEVFETLARIHEHYRGQSHRLAGIVEINADWWREMCLEVTLPVVEEKLAEHDDSVLRRAARSLRETAEDERILRALSELPPTLLHGDMHCGNIIVGQRAVTIIDWGNARIGPAMLDIANIAELDSPYCRAYGESAAVGYFWAQCVINTQYMGWVLRSKTSSDLQRMLDKRDDALSRL